MVAIDVKLHNPDRKILPQNDPVKLGAAIKVSHAREYGVASAS
jgi:hypothetical protein